MILVLFLSIMTPLHILTHYGNESYDYVSIGELVSYDFLYNKIENYYITGGSPVSTYKFNEIFKYVSFKELKFNGENYISNSSSLRNHSIIISRGDIELFKRLNNDDKYVYNIENNISNNKNYMMTYSNGEINLYNKEN